MNLHVLLLCGLAIPALTTRKEDKELDMLDTSYRADHLEEHASVFQTVNMEGSIEMHGDSVQWTATRDDLNKIQDVLLPMLNANRPADEPEWEFENNPNNMWYFPLTQMTAQGPEGALALHMMHRHGLAPLVASRSKDFEVAWQASGNAHLKNSTEKAQRFLEFQEQYPEVKNLRAALESISLNGLRNLHSWDHQWSVDTGVRRGDKGCTTSMGGLHIVHTIVPAGWFKGVDEALKGPGNCVLQAGQSAAANNFLRTHGFTPSVCGSLMRSAAIFLGRITGVLPLGPDMRLQPVETGRLSDVVDYNIAGTDNFLMSFAYGSKKLQVTVRMQTDDNGALRDGWFGKGNTHKLTIPLDEKDSQALEAASEQEKGNLVQGIARKFIDQKLTEHRDYMLKNRITIWANEEAEFAMLYDNYNAP